MTTIWPYVVGLGVVTGLGHIGLFFFLLLFRRNEELTGNLTLAYLGVSALWGVSVTLAGLESTLAPEVAQVADRLTVVFVAALAVGQLLLAAAFLELPELSSIAGAGGAWVGILLVVIILSLAVPVPELPFLAIGQVAWLVPTAALIGLMSVTLFRSRLALHRNRALYWLLATVPLAVGQALTLLPIGPLRAFGPLLHLSGAAALTRGAMTYWLPNVKAVLRSILRFLLLAMLTAGLLLGVVIGADQLTGQMPFSRTTLLIALAVAAALIHSWLYRLLQRLVDRLLEGVGFDPGHVLREYSHTISTILDSKELATVAVETAAKVLDIQRGALLVATATKRGKLQLRPVSGLGEVSSEPIAFAPTSPIPARICERYTPLFQYEIDVHPELRKAQQEERDWLRQLGMEVYLPIWSQDQLTGILALGPKGTGEPYNHREVAFLSTLAQQTGVALSNARLVEGLRSLNIHITQLNRNLRVAYERLERLDQAKTDFLAIASHELRTPLTQIRGYTDILADLAETAALTSDQVQRIAQNISSPTRRLENIIDAMVDASEIEAEGLAMHFTPTTLSSIVRLAIERWGPALQERNIALTVTGLEDIASIRADMERLCQAFGNLISNAIKFTPDGGQIALEARPLNDDYFEVIVADSGIGVSKTDQELIFEKFYRVGSVSLHSSGEYKFKGAGPGLGLPITRGVIEGHGGRIWLESEGYDEEKCPGSTVHIVLPYAAHRGPCHWRETTD